MDNQAPLPIDKSKKRIREYTWFLLVITIINLVLIIGAGLYIGTISSILTWQIYLSFGLMIIYLVGLFSYKKWGFYVFTAFLVYLLISNIISLNFIRLIILLLVYGYLVWYRGFYKNLSSLN